ncbi:hypothetical protein CU098_007105 [Rhizopus stolonifer]|uniref:Uncharacterized protein n=1 Tax=Rhizopus stolonifer TaxID=4846 RepID=A0A367KJ43_RHIST|nr:hypothetical protein CU098_007105 [Rhizopus stolonifer]
MRFGHIQKEKKDAMEEIEDDFYYRLQRHSALYRILLSRPYSSEIHFNQWNRIDLKLVNEFGLTLTNKQKMSCWLEIDCRLLVNKDHRIQTCQDYEVFCRPIQKDGWESTVQSEIAGFQHDTEGNFEYMVVVKDEGLELSPDALKESHTYFLQISPTRKQEQTIHAFPLMIGPFAIKETMIPTTPNGKWYEPPLSFNIFHAYCLLDQSYLIVKEDWKLGTSGKLWDSALVLSHMFCDKIQKNPFYFKDRRLLDLSAGTGCIGLLLASLLKDMYRDQPDSMPEITMTDLPEALDLIHQNRTYNHLEDYTHIMPLAWGNYEDAKQVLMKGPIHTIIASDVLYEPASFQKLVQTLDWLSTEGDVDIYLGYKRRGLSLEEELSFFNICSKRFHIRMLCSSLYSEQMTNYPHVLSQKEGWALNEFSSMCLDSGVNIYQLVRK